jgi:serine/threonine protein kinase
MLKKVKIATGNYIDLSSGRYFIEKELGEGGFGSVYKARKENRSFAIKLNRIWELFPADREEIKKRIVQEFEISHTIRSAHIVKAYSLDELHENPILVMDYCAGGSLRNKIEATPGMDKINRVALQILNGLNALHSYGIIHRDIKPENILFNDEIAKLTDFGISANLKHRLTRTDIRGHATKVFATLSYSPPEQSQRSQSYKKTAPTIDIFSFGVIMFELITKGNLPFGSIKDYEKDARAVEEKKASGNWDKTTLQKSIENNYWYKIIDTCLMPDPRKRFTCTEEIIELLVSEKPKLLNRNVIWKIIITDGFEKGKEYNLTNLSKYLNKKILTLGRYDGQNPFMNDIAVKEDKTTYISTHHGTFECLVINNTPQWYLRDGQWYERDGIKGWHASSNGIKINSKQIDQNGTILNDHDIIQAGKTTLRVSCD